MVTWTKVVADCNSSPVHRRTHVTERRTLSAGQDGRHPVTVWREVPPAYGVNAAVNGDEVASREASLNPLRIKTQPQKLAS